MLTLKSRVAEVARAKGIRSSTALARVAKLHRATVAAWWGQLPRSLHAPTLCKLCQALDVQPGALLVLVDSDEPSPQHYGKSTVK